jgi:hypothetical protein
MARRHQIVASTAAVLMLLSVVSAMRNVRQHQAFIPSIEGVGRRYPFADSTSCKASPQGGEFSVDVDQEVLAIASGLPTLGHFVIAEAEPNVPAQATQSRFSGLRAMLGLRSAGTGSRARRRKGLAAPAAGVGAAVGFMALGPFGAAVGAVMSALATKKDGPAGDAARMTAKAAGSFSPQAIERTCLFVWLAGFPGPLFLVMNFKPGFPDGCVAYTDLERVHHCRAWLCFSLDALRVFHALKLSMINTFGPSFLEI